MSRGTLGKGPLSNKVTPWLFDASRTLCHHSPPASLSESRPSRKCNLLHTSYISRQPFFLSPLLLYPATVPRRIHPWGRSSHGVSHPSFNLLPPPPRPLLPPAMQSSYHRSSMATLRSSSATVVSFFFVGTGIHSHTDYHATVTDNALFVPSVIKK